MGTQGIIPPNINYNKNISDGYQIRPYTAGETCIHNNTLYKAKQDITVAEEWNPEHWEETTVEQELSAVNANIANIAPDDTAVDGKPWTSKHIVDMLCPPLEVSGNPVQCYPVPGYPLGITASWEPTQEGTGDPSPDNIRPIKGRNSVAVTRCGQNLLKTSGAIWNSTVSGYFYFTRDVADKNTNVYVHLAAGVRYTLQADGNNDVVIFAKTATQVNNTQIGNLSSNGSTATCTFSVDKSGDYTIWAWYSAPLDTPPYNNPMLCVGEAQKNEYVPYIGDTTTLTLPETIYGGSVDAVSGNGAQTHVLTLLTGQENWRKAESGSLSAPVPIGKATRGAYALCSVAPPEYAYSGGGIYTTTDAIIFGDRFGAQYATVEAWTTYLAEQNAAGTPVQVVYKLATPIVFQASGVVAMPALEGINTVFTDADSVAVTGREDLLHVLSGIQSSE